MHTRRAFLLSFISSPILHDIGLNFTTVSRKFHGGFSFTISCRTNLFLVCAILPGPSFESTAAEDDNQDYRIDIEKKSNVVYKPPY